ncbi:MULTISPECIES: hypothetical protein [unclassified Chryseobacterium]|uniref:hypothetical protein n=1 Tax=unclassified Chryseobacterium TaxID=2593645 RepID=UPI001E560F51|nr:MULTISPECIES: hypothetical protein [unclassified Chryseobacterium]
MNKNNHEKIDNPTSYFFNVFFKCSAAGKNSIGSFLSLYRKKCPSGRIRIRLGNSYDGSIILGPSLLYTHVNDKDKFIPEMNVNILRAGLLIGVSGNPYSLEPRIGFSLFNAIFLNTGYAFPIHKEKYFKGITFGIQFNIAQKHSKFYDHLKMM